MDLFLIHCVMLAWTTVVATRQLCARAVDRLLAAALLAWANIVVSCLLLSALQRLGEPAWFLGVSTALALLACLAVAGFKPEAADEPATGGPSPLAQGLFTLSIVPLALASIAAACAYEPGNPDSLSFQLPRAMYYLGQGSLSPFTAADLRQTGLPFNCELVRLFALVYGPPVPVLNLFNLLAWGTGGLAVYRLCRLCQIGANAALGAAWLGLAATPVLAQASSTTPDLLVGAALVCASVFILRWQRAHRPSDAWLGGVAAGLAGGSSWCALCLVTIAGLFLAVRAIRQPTAAGGSRQWVALIVAGLPAGVLGLSFAFVNWHGLAARPGSSSFHAATALPRWQDLVPLLQRPAALGELDEDSIGLGPAGGLILLCGLLSAVWPRKVAGWFAVAAFAWIAAGFLFPTTQPFHARNWLPALWLLGPCVAATIQTPLPRPLAFRTAIGLVTGAVMLATGWSAGVYLLHNSRQPLAQLLADSVASPDPIPMPLRLTHRLATQPRVNIDTDGANERIFPLMTRRPGQRLTSERRTDRSSYTLVSRASLGRSSDSHGLPGSATHTLISLAHKRSAGVEFLAVIGDNALARDYFGLESDTATEGALASNRNLLFILDRPTGAAAETSPARLRLLGLNSADLTRVAVNLESNDGEIVHLADLTADGVVDLPRARPFRRLLFAACDLTTGKPADFADLPDLPSVDLPNSADSLLPSSPLSIFSTDLVLRNATGPIHTEGLLPTEGPFPQWDLPYIRWAQQPDVKIVIPATPRLASLRLSFSVRLHVRQLAEFELRFNGVSIRRYRLEGQMRWLNETLTLDPKPGTNILEFHDLPLSPQPNWLEYLDRYPDVRQHVLAHNLPLEEGAKEHYELSGKAEGRTVKLIEPPKAGKAPYYFMFRSVHLEGFRSP